MNKVISNNKFWSLVDSFENGRQTKTEACIIIGEEYQKAKSNDLNQAFADVQLLLKFTATKRQYNYLKKHYFGGL